MCVKFLTLTHFKTINDEIDYVLHRTPLKHAWDDLNGSVLGSEDLLTSRSNKFQLDKRESDSDNNGYVPNSHKHGLKVKYKNRVF